MDDVTDQQDRSELDRHAQLTLPETPQLELDQLLSQLVDRVQEVLSTQGRLRGLLRANQMIVSDLDLSSVLRHIVEAACVLVGARYAALAVIGLDGGLAEFVHVGMDDATVARIGQLPEGKGLVGALLEDPQTIRLRSISADARSVGFPEGHPPMESFLGVPIRVRDQVFGNLYLTESDKGEFCVEDEELVVALAATAGIAIENARLYRQAERRQEWLHASAQIIRQLLSVRGEDPLRVIAARVRELAEADVVSVVLRVPDSSRLMVEVAVGESAEGLIGMTFSSEGSLAARAISDGLPLLVDDIEQDPNYTVHLSRVLPVGPVMLLPLSAAHNVGGVLVVGRKRPGQCFSDVDLSMATTFANYAAVALQLADARADQQRVVLLEERDRIARDLHDHIIQRLFATGLTLQSLSSALGPGERADRLGEQVGALDDTIRQIRTMIFQLHGPAENGPAGVRSQVLQVVRQLSDALPVEPWVQFAGPIDALASVDVADDLLAVVREALTNVAKHAQAHHVGVHIDARLGEVTVTVTDDGQGIADNSRRSGLSNLQARAERHGGTLSIESGTHGGTTLRWTAQVR